MQTHNNPEANPVGQFGSRLGFIMAAAGSAVGLGNIWKFPYSAGSNGGGAFVLVYLFFVALVGLPVLLSELSLGRSTRSNPVGAYRAKGGKAWVWVGRLGVLTGVVILSFYSVVAGWTLRYLYWALRGDFTSSLTTEASAKLFEAEVTGRGFEAAGLAALFLLATAVIVRGGISHGIERASKVLMPAFLVVLIALVVRSLTLEGASEGLFFLFNPDFSKLSGGAVLGALGQALFSLSLGMGGMITYGSYLSKEENLFKAGLLVAIFDTLIAITAGLIIFPALFAAGGSPTGGPGLVFVVLPTIFGTLPAAYLFSVAFYALLAVAALTSTMSLLEVAVSYCVGERKWSRETSVWVVTIICFGLAIPSALSFGSSSAMSRFIGTEGWVALGFVSTTSFFGVLDFVFGSISLAVGSLLLCLLVGFRWGTAAALQEMDNPPGAGFMAMLLKYVCPLAVLLVLLRDLGFFAF